MILWVSGLLGLSIEICFGGMKNIIGLMFVMEGDMYS